jgi:O-antigen/teichoic acid export membrane protein
VTQILKFHSTKIHWSAKDKLFRDSLVMFAATVVGSLCNYLYQIYIGRALGPEGYGAFGSLFAIVYFAAVFSSTVQAGAAWLVSRSIAMGGKNDVTSILHGLIIRSSALGILGFLAFSLSSPYISDFLQISSIDEVVVLGTVFLFSFLLPATSGVLQGMQRFNSLALVNILTFAPKLAFGVLLVSLGYGISGALGGLTLGMAVAFIISLAPLRSCLVGRVGISRYDFRELYVYSMPTMLVMICLTVPSNLDVIMAKHFFNGHEAGLYTAASVLGKAVLFVSSAIYMVMFPKVSEMKAVGGDTLRLLNVCLIYTALLSGTAAVVLAISPGLVGLIFGSSYIDASTVMQSYSAAMFFLSLIWAIAYYCLAIDDHRYAYLLISSTLLEAGLLSMARSSTLQMAHLMAAVNLFLFIASYGYVLLFRCRDQK